MNKQPQTFNGYPPHSTLSAESALVTAWSALEYFRSDLVVIGGLAVHYHTRNTRTPSYQPTATQDVDFGIQVEADAGLRATASFALAMADFEKTDEGRDFRPLNEGQLFLDFLTENPPKTQGTCNVSELNASICPERLHLPRH